jgi:hypothetical protein
MLLSLLTRYAEYSLGAYKHSLQAAATHVRATLLPSAATLQLEAL